MSTERSTNFSKEIEPIHQYIRTSELYRQSGGASPMYILLPFDGVHSTFESGVLLATVKNEVADIYINRQHMIERAQRALNQEQTGKPVIHQEYIQWCHERDAHVEYARKLELSSITTYSQEELLKELRMYNAIVHALWRFSFIIDCFDPNGAELLQHHVWSAYPQISNEEREVLLRHIQPTTQELMEKRALELSIGQQQDATEQLKKEFHWVENNYTGVRDLALDHFTTFISECTARYSTIASRLARISEIASTAKRVEQTKNKLIKQYGISTEHQRVVTLFSFLTDWREQRKRTTQMMAWCFQQFINAFAAQWQCDRETVAQAHSEEYELLSSPPSQRHAVLEQRRASGMVYAMDNRSGQRYLIDDPRDVDLVFALIDKKLYNEQLTEIHGMVARKGKIQGIVRVINHVNDFEKFHDGDILVSGMTRPELMPVIRKAGGIITDEGGITCHAAVVSRELGIPCIIGTQVATRTLNDGDVVLLDADNGVIHKIQTS